MLGGCTVTIVQMVLMSWCIFPQPSAVIVHLGPIDEETSLSLYVGSVFLPCRICSASGIRPNRFLKTATRHHNDALQIGLGKM